MTDLEELDNIATKLGCCYSVGKTRLSTNLFECRMYTRKNVKKPIVVIGMGTNIPEAISNCLEKLKQRTLL